MKHFSYVNKNIFIEQPINFNRNTEKDLLQFALGATMYMPGTKDIYHAIINKKWPELTSMVMCFEDAIPEEDLELAEETVFGFLDKMAKALKESIITINDLPLFIIRVRNIDQFVNFTNSLSKDQIELLTAFNFPKMTASNVRPYFSQLEKLNQKFSLNLYGMPIIESAEAAFIENSQQELVDLKNALLKYSELVLNIRVGATDFSSLFGVRRSIDSTIYEVLTVRDSLSNILNVFTRNDVNYVVSAPVWEYFDTQNVPKRPGTDNFIEDLLSRKPLFNKAIDGLLREILQDKNNGFIGRTIIHPTHIKFVNAMQAVTLEEYEDAKQVLNTIGGVIKSIKSNKMNEINPHRSWATKILSRAKVFGVIKDTNDYVKLFDL